MVDPTIHDDVLREEGFRPVGRLDYRLHLTAWWHPAADRLLQVIVLSLGRAALVKGDKSYYVESVSAEGETWARDVGLLHDYLEGHFPELRLAFSHFRDVPPELARAEVRRRTAIEAPAQPTVTVEQVAELQRKLLALRRDLRSTDDLMALSTAGPDLLSGYVHQQARTRQAQVEQLQSRIERQRQRLELLDHLQREYQRKGSAAVYTFAVSSNLQVAADPAAFRDALRAVVKELTDMHRYQVTQKLGGGRLNVRVTEATEPAMAWIEQWLGGALTPAQVRRLGPEFDLVRRAAERHVMVTPDEPIVVEGHVRHAPKHVAARFVADALGRLDKTGGAARDEVLAPGSVPAEAMPLNLGVRVDEAGAVLGPVSFPLARMVHLYVSGTTGSGKSYLARVLIEEAAAAHERLGVLVLDPRNQSVGLLTPEDRPQILRRYEEFGMDAGRARGFPFRYFAPGLSYAPPLPNDLATLGAGRSIVSFKGCDDGRRCVLAAQVLDAAFGACSAQESDGPRLLVVVDEAQLFTRRRTDESAKQAAGQAERALDRIAREGRKFGIVLALVSQSMKDFSHDLASIRQMTTTKVFLRNSDREIEYAADIVGDGRLLVQLPTGTALLHNAHWGVARIRVRPPYSKVFEPGEAETRQIVGPGRNPSTTVSAEARRLYDRIREHANSPSEPLNMTRAAELAGISSKRKLLDLVGELEQAGLVRTRRLPERGSPRVIEPVHKVSRAVDAPAAGMPLSGGNAASLRGS